jgi:hypothetical protein
VHSLRRLATVFFILVFLGDVFAQTGVDLKRSQAIAQKKVSDYAGKAGQKALVEDLNFLRVVEKGGAVFPKTEEFESAWIKNQKKLLDPAVLGMMDPSTEVRTLFLTVMTASLAENAAAIDARDPKTEELRAKGESTAGDNYFSIGMKKVRESDFLTLTFALSAAIAVTKTFGNLLYYAVVVPLTNTGLAPFTRPINEKVEQIAKSNVEPREITVWWNRLVSGENRRTKKAMKEAAKRTAAKLPDEITNAELFFTHPSVPVAEAAKEWEAFVKSSQMLQAEQQGIISEGIARARDVGFGTVFGEWANYIERVGPLRSAEATADLVLNIVTLPALYKGGATDEDIARLSLLLRKQKDIMTFQGALHPDAQALHAPIREEVVKMLEKGVNDKALRSFYFREQDRIAAENGRALLTALWVKGEMLFKQNNYAIRKRKDFQKWQETSREMVNFYEELERQPDRIASYLKAVSPTDQAYALPQSGLSDSRHATSGRTARGQLRA